MAVAGNHAHILGGSLASQPWAGRLPPFWRGLQERRSRRGGHLRGGDAPRHAVRADQE
ncbi:hypothetical protein FQZ97_451360 [compost metagenome]